MERGIKGRRDFLGKEGVRERKEGIKGKDGDSGQSKRERRRCGVRGGLL